MGDRHGPALGTRCSRRPDVLSVKGDAEMAKKTKQKKQHAAEEHEPQAGMKRKAYEAELRKLHAELVALQEWVKSSGAKVCVVFEGRDTAGKGGTIKAITERVSPRVFRVVALPSPTDREKSQMYVQRYVPHLPGRRRGRHLRPQLVQPGRRRTGDGLLHGGAGHPLPRAGSRRREGDGRLGDHAAEVLAGGEPGRADPPAAEPHRRPPQDRGSSRTWT